MLPFVEFGDDSMDVIDLLTKWIVGFFGAREDREEQNFRRGVRSRISFTIAIAPLTICGVVSR